MSPRPLSSFPDDIEVQEMSAALKVDDELVALVGRMVGAWAELEVQLTNLATGLLQADFAPVAAMVGALKSARRDAIEAAGEVVLSGERLDIFRALMKRVKAAEKRRNRYAHWVWLEVVGHTNLLALAPQRAVVDATAFILETSARIGQLRTLREAGATKESLSAVYMASYERRQPKPDIRSSGVLVYDIDDIREDCNEVVRVAVYVDGMALLLHPLRRPTSNEEDVLLASLREVLLPGVTDGDAAQRSEP